MHSFISVFFVVLLVTFGVAGCKKKEPPKPTEVTVVEVIEDEIHEIWTLVGQTVSDPKVELLARVKGFLVKRNFKQGAFVKKDELLFQIEKDQYQAAVDQAKAEVAIKEAVLKNAIISYKRYKFLREKDSVSQADLDKATADKDSAIGDRDAAKAALQEAALNLGYTDIKSPFEGRIGLAKYNVGNMISPESGVLATVVSLDPMRVEFSINEAVFLRAQQKALELKISLEKLLADLNIKLILSNGTIYAKTGKIYFWNNAVSSDTGTILMRAEFENPEFILTPGQYVKVQIQSSIPQKGLVMPQAAIQSALGGKFVMVVDKNNIIQTKDIKLGYRFASTIVIKDGLLAGDKVVTQGIQKVNVGMKVTPVVAPAVDDDTPKKDKNKATDDSAGEVKVDPVK
jgi:membrane fusion protein, multidrug efflux system